MDRYERIGKAVSHMLMEMSPDSEPPLSDQYVSTKGTCEEMAKIQELKGEIGELRGTLGQVLRHNFGKPILPDNTETVAICLECPKTAALFFDRVWSIPGFETGPYKDIMAYGATDAEIAFSLLVVWLASKDPSQEFATLSSCSLSTKEQLQGLFPLTQKIPVARFLAESLNDQMDVSAVPVYSSASKRDNDFGTGHRAALVWSIRNIQLIREDKLEWSQVREIRNDTEARTKLHRLINWMVSEMAGQPASFIESQLAAKLDDYEWALKKHGIQCLTGVLSSIIDPKFLATSAATVAALSLTVDRLVSAISVASLAFARVTLEASKSMLDLKDKNRNSFPEIAYLHEIRKKLDS